MGWFKIMVKGTLGYAGVPRGLDAFRGSVVPAAAVIVALEQWLIDYAERNRSGDIYPHGWIAGVRGGWPERPAFPTAVTEIFCDVRISPRTTPGEVKAQFAAFMADQVGATFAAIDRVIGLGYGYLGDGAQMWRLFATLYAQHGATMTFETGKKAVYDDDIAALVDDEVMRGHDRIRFVSLDVHAGSKHPARAEMELEIDLSVVGSPYA